MDPIYVIGHRNPDTDSVVAAISYAALRNALGDREYEPACLGHISDETRRVLDRFGFHPPRQIFDVYTQIKDLDYDTPPILSEGMTVARAWDIMEQQNTDSLAVARPDGTLYGMLAKEDIAQYHMQLIKSAYLRPVPIFNLLSVLEGTLLHDGGACNDTLSGNVTIALPQQQENLLFQSADSIVICADQPDMIRRALERNVNCLILCQTQLDEGLKAIADSTCIISTPYDAYHTVKMLLLSAPVKRICRNRDLLGFYLEDRMDVVKEQILKHRGHCYPVIDDNEQVVGLLTRDHLLHPRRKRVVLVDHNETAQSVSGLEEANILEIIDHHRLADIQTMNPIYVRNEPVGSTNTILASMFQEKGLLPSAELAGMMASAIISDTVMFKSPTCTSKDRSMAERMARIANVSLDELGEFIFSSDLKNRDAKELLMSDYKEFHIAGFDLAIAQITCIDSPELAKRKTEFLRVMAAIKRERKVHAVMLMLTDVLLDGTRLLYVGEDDMIRQAFGIEPKDSEVFLPNVMSRKKQVIPSLSVLLG